jgi:Fe-S-cluster-containing hydrogenase component 2/CRP-like cAMP-binding protein/thioredoxin reductase
MLDVEAGREGPSYILLDGFDHPSKTIFRYQKGKHVMAEPGYLNLRSDLGFERGSREDILDNWNTSINSLGMNISLNSDVRKISGSKGNFQIETADERSITAEHVILAIGLEGNPRRLGVPGDTPPNVQYQLDDPDEFEGEHIIVVGAGDAAVENALGLARQNRVTILNRKGEFSRIKDGNQNLILRAVSDAGITLDCLYNSGVAKIDRPDTDGRLIVALKTPEGIVEVHADRIVARLGAIPPRGFLESCGIELPHGGPNALPELSDQFETNIAGLYVIGSLAGYPLIKQAMNQGYDVVEFINGHSIKPVDHALLTFQFSGLPYQRDADELVALLMKRIPMFRQLNGLAFRELVIESTLYASYPDAGARNDAHQEIAELMEKIAVDYPDAESRPGITQILRDGDLLYREGDFGVSFFIVLDGEAHLESDAIPGGRRTLSQGEFFGEMSLIAGQPRPETARVGRNCALMEVPRRTILKLMNSNDVVREGIDWIFLVREMQRHFAPMATIEELRAVTKLIPLRTYSPGQPLWEEGEPSEAIHLIRNGTVAIYRNSGGRRSVVAELRAGAIVGQMAMFGEAIRGDSAIASVYVETLEISGEAFNQLMAFDPEQRDQIRKSATNRLIADADWGVRPESGDLLDFLLADGIGEATDALIIDEYLCIGCNNCEIACAETHGGVSRLDRAAGQSMAHLHIPQACRHCEQPHCMKDCPPNAIHRSSNGEVFIDDSCIGCGNCQTNCPYDVIRMEYPAPSKPGLLNWLLLGAEPGPGEEPGFTPDGSAANAVKKAVKCDACMNLDGGPACVSACPTGAAIRISPEQIVTVIERRP